VKRKTENTIITTTNSFGFLEKITFINKDSFDVNASMSHLMIILKKKFFSANEKKSQTTKISLLFDIEKY